tara:strand:- start:305 stop:799 length:495 start_codon:yes stop_codon:yes gene_type:complete
MYNEELLKLFVNKIPDIILSVFIFIMFIIIGKIIERVIIRVLNKKNTKITISKVIGGIIKNILVIIGFISALGTLGVNVSAIVAGLGLSGFAFGFAFKDMLSNFISGLLIFIYEPFKLGNVIEVDGKVGKVVDINLRYVTIETDTNKALVPNSISVSKVVLVHK